MFQHHFARRAMLAAIVPVITIAPLAAQAEGSHAAGTYLAVMTAKDPSHYGPNGLRAGV